MEIKMTDWGKMGITEEFIATSPSGTVYMTMSLQRLLNFFSRGQTFVLG